MGNLVLNKPASASSYVKPYSPSRAVNGTMTAVSRWLANMVPAWLSVNLQGRFWINRWVVRHMAVSGWQAPQYVLSGYKLQGSLDGANWFDLDVLSGITASVTDRTIPAVEVAHVRVYVTSGLNINPKMASFAELEVYEAPPTSPYLANLTLSDGILTPSFVKTTTSYTAAVGHDITQITLTPTAEDPAATIKVNGVAVPSGQATVVQLPNVGDNTISVQVTSKIGNLVQNYTVVVNRASNTYLSNLVLKSGTKPLALSPAPFVNTTTAYTATVASTIATVTLTPTAEDTNATIRVAGNVVISGQPSVPLPLSAGPNLILVTVTPATGTVPKEYTVTVTRNS